MHSDTIFPFIMLALIVFGPFIILILWSIVSSIKDFFGVQKRKKNKSYAQLEKELAEKVKENNELTNNTKLHEKKFEEKLIQKDQTISRMSVKIEDLEIQVIRKDREIRSLSQMCSELSSKNKDFETKLSYFDKFKSNLTAIPYMAAIMSDYETYHIEEFAHKLDWGDSWERENKVKSIREIRKDAKAIVEKNKEAQYQLAYLLNLFPSLKSAMYTDYNLIKDKFKSNLTAIPYMAALIADYETYGLEKLASKLDWGNSSERANKVKSIREIRKDAKAIVEKNKEAQYQLAYLLNLFPNLSDIIDCEFNQLPMIEVKDISDYDTTRDYLSKEEYSALTVTERNQLALDRYKKSHSKSKWQIGRDYELYVGYRYNQKGYIVEYFGSEKRLEDMGRDLIAFKGGKTLIVQCKYWSSEKLIHEKHVMQLYGTMVSYCIENEVDKNKVHGVLVTNISLSETAKKVAEYLNIEYKENFEKGDYPCIKCNIGKDENGKSTKIYHLPFDQQYDSTIIHGPDEFFAMTVAEAENAGFRRAFKWFGSK